MIRAKHNYFVYLFFQLYARIKMKKHFNSIITNHKTENNNQSILLISNHISWWDGFWGIYLSTRFFKRKFYFMMSEKELKKRILFSYSGGFSIRPGHKSIIESLNYTFEILRNPQNLVLMFPQGKLNSLYKYPVQFQSGLNWLLKKNDIPFRIIFLVSTIDYFDHPTPDLYLNVKEYNRTDLNTPDIENAYNEFYKECLNRHKQMSL